MLAHVFFIPFISSFVLVSHETSSPSGLFTFVFELAHMALNSFASGQLHYQASIFYCCVDSQCVYGRISPCIFVLILAEVLKDALQPNFQQVEDRRLRVLVQDFPAVLLKSKADSTAKKYEKGFNTSRKWASQFKEIVIFPASSVHVSLFFLCLIQESAACSTIDEVHYGLKWVHDLAGLPNPCNSSLVLP